MKPHAFHPEADAEYAESAETYAGYGAELGGRFYDEIEGLIAAIKEAPHRFRQYDPPRAATWPKASRLPWSTWMNLTGFGSWR